MHPHGWVGFGIGVLVGYWVLPRIVSSYKKGG